MLWYILLGVAIGMAIGVAIGVITITSIVKRRKVGVMNVYIPPYTDETPYVSPEFTHGADFVCKQKYVLFDVNVRSLK